MGHIIRGTRYGRLQDNYSTFEDDGTYIMYGNATIFDDLPPTPILISRLGTTAPTLATFIGNVEQYTFGVSDYVEGATELTHKYKEGSDIDIHIHWATNGLEGVDKAVKWQLEYTIANLDAAFGAASTVSAEETILANTADRTHYLTDIGTITGTSVTIGAYIVWRLTRIAASGTAPAANPFGTAVGFHVEMDTIGSRTEDAK